VDSSLASTALYEQHRSLGARLVPFAGYQMPVQYEGIVAEHTAVRERVGLFDVSHMGELFLTGPNALGFVDSLVSNAVHAMPVGRALYTVCANERGTILDDLIIYRLGDAEVLVICNAGNLEKISTYFGAKAAEAGVPFEDRSASLSLMALQGPKAEATLRAAGGGAFADLGTFHILRGELSGVPTIAARTGYTGEDGFEICVPNEGAVKVWRALLAAGAEFGIAPVGLGARDTLRLEARLSLYGNDIDETTNAYEAGLAWVVKLDGPDFVGKQALAKIKAEGVHRKLVGFEMRGRGIARHGYPFVDEAGAEIGIVTSGSPSPTLKKNIGLGYVPKAMSQVGTPLRVLIRGKAIEAEVVKTPFYKRAK